MKRTMLHITAGDENWNPNDAELQHIADKFMASLVSGDPVATRSSVYVTSVLVDTEAVDPLAEDFSVAGIEYPEDGSHWTHTNGNIYEVLFLTNIETKDIIKYPTTVVYQNIENGACYSRPLSRWHASMTPVDDID